MLDRARGATRDTSLLEFRLDYLDKPLESLPELGAFLAQNTALSAIATCRSEPSGGHFKGSVAAEVEILVRAAEAGFQLIDLSVESAEAAKRGELDRLRATGAALIVSYHDFKATKDLDAAYARLAKFSPDFFKIVPTARTLADNLMLIRFLERISDQASVVGICMGDSGVISRVLGVRAGSAFTFAAAEPGEETAPGQIDARTLLGVYRIAEVDAATRVYGVAGSPVSHSLSPLMMNAAFRRETQNSVYLALKASSAADLLRLVHEIPIHGLSITMPLKLDILQHLDRVDPLSQKIGAVNTVVRTSEGKLLGFNTDVAGILNPLERRLSLRGASVLVLGAGGAARAAVFGLVDKGADVFVSNRTPETGQKLARQAHAKSLRHELIAKQQFDVIINATPVGMTGGKAQSPLTREELKARLVFDLVYNPLETPLLRMAREAGIPIITGVEMFVQQGARQFELWTGKQAPEEEMLRVVLHALRSRTDGAQPRREEPAPPIDPAAETGRAEQGPVGETASAAPAPVRSSRSPVTQVKTPARTALDQEKAAARKSKNGTTSSSAKRAPLTKATAKAITPKGRSAAAPVHSRKATRPASAKSSSRKTSRAG